MCATHLESTKNKRKENFNGISHIGDCATDGDCRYKEKTNSDLKTKCDTSLSGTSYSTRGPDFTASTAANPYSPKTLYKCGCQDNYIQKSDNWRQEGCGEYGIPVQIFSKYIILLAYLCTFQISIFYVKAGLSSIGTKLSYPMLK